MSMIALEFETNQILVAAARVTNKAFEVQHAFAVPIEPNNEAAAIEALKIALAKHSLSRSDAIVIVNRAAVEMREFEVPPAPDNELPEMVRFVSRNEFASLNENWLLDFVPLAKDSAQKRKVLAAGLSPERHSKLAKMIDGAGLKLKHIVLRPFAAYDLLQPKLSGDMGRLIVDPNDDQTDMIITFGRDVVATRTVRTPATDDPTQRNQVLLGEIKRTLASASGALGEREIKQVVFFGDAADHVALETKLKEELHVDFESREPFQLVPRSSQLSVPTSPTRYAPLLGALAQQFSGTRHALDFLNPRRPVVKTIDRSRQFLYGGIAAGVALLAMLIAWWTLRNQTAEIAALNSKLNAAIAANAGDAKLPGVKQLMGEVSRIDDWKKADIDWLEELYQTSNRLLTPDDAIVDSLDALIRSGEPEMVIRSRMAGIQKESALLDSLYSRPYRIKTPTTKASDEDQAYTISYDFTVELAADRSNVISDIDAQALEALKRRNAPRPLETPSAPPPLTIPPYQKSQGESK